VLVLPPGQGVQVDDRVQAVAGQGVDHPVEPGEAGLLQLKRRGVVLEVAVVDRDAYAVEPDFGEQRGVGVGEEAVEELGEERLVRLLPHGLAHQPTDAGLGAGVAGDEVLHVHPAAQPEADQPDGGARLVDDPVAVDAQPRQGRAHQDSFSRSGSTSSATS
jgi:hypothetical protein